MPPAPLVRQGSKPGEGHFKPLLESLAGGDLSTREQIGADAEGRKGLSWKFDVADRNRKTVGDRGDAQAITHLPAVLFSELGDEAQFYAAVFGCAQEIGALVDNVLKGGGIVGHRDADGKVRARHLGLAYRTSPHWQEDKQDWNGDITRGAIPGFAPPGTPSRQHGATLICGPREDFPKWNY